MCLSKLPELVHARSLHSAYHLGLCRLYYHRTAVQLKADSHFPAVLACASNFCMERDCDVKWSSEIICRVTAFSPINHLVSSKALHPSYDIDQFDHVN